MGNRTTQSEDLKFIESFKTENWDRTSCDEKLESLQKLENYMANKQGRIAREVRPIKMEDYARGYYDQQDPKYLKINKSLLEENGPTKCNNYKAMQNVIHEGRHAYQDDAIIGRVKTEEKDKDKIEQWSKNSPGLGGVYNNTNNCPYTDYRFQPIEADANDFSDMNIKSFNDRLGNDKNYQNYIAKRDLSNEHHKTVVTEFYGDDYEKKIANSINEKYERKNGLKTPNHVEEGRKMSGLSDELKRLRKNDGEIAEEDRKKMQVGLSKKGKGNSNSPSPQIREIGRQPAKSNGQER